MKKKVKTLIDSALKSLFW